MCCEWAAQVLLVVVLVVTSCGIGQQLVATRCFWQQAAAAAYGQPPKSNCGVGWGLWVVDEVGRVFMLVGMLNLDQSSSCTEQALSIDSGGAVHA